MSGSVLSAGDTVMNGKHTILIAWSFVSNGRDRHFSNNTMHLITTVTDNTEKSMVVLHCNEKGSVNTVWKEVKLLKIITLKVEVYRINWTMHHPNLLEISLNLVQKNCQSLLTGTAGIYLYNILSVLKCNF